MPKSFAALVRAVPLPARVAEIVRERHWYWLRLRSTAASVVIRGYRPLLRGVTFIAITGSCGKSTTKELIGGTLATRMRGTRTADNDNQPWHIAVALMRVRPADGFSVQEVGIGKQGEQLIARSAALIRPTIAVVTNIGTDHISAFGSKAAIAQEKAKLVASLPASGVAVLNADDPLVLAMRAQCKGRVITYGQGADADVRADDVRCAWPDRLSFTVHFGGEATRVDTTLCGEHWVSAALATIATWIAMGYTPKDAAQALPAVAPFANRMCPVTRADGVTFVFDDAKSPLWTLGPALGFMRTARASRRYAVIGTLSDYQGRSDKAYAAAAREARGSVDHVLFVGSRASKSRREYGDGVDDRVEAVYAIDEAAAMLARRLEPGDLVLLKGTPADRLERFFEAPREEPHEREAGAGSARSGWVQAAIGLGNPEGKYRDSPHNAGHAVIDALARFFDVPFVSFPEASVASVAVTGGTVHLVKLACPVNDSGEAILALGPRLDVRAQDCVIVHDDLALPPGTVRARLRGNDGGHNGVRSILNALRTIEVRRVKVGVGRPADGTSVEDYVLTPMTGERERVMREAYLAAASRTLVTLGESAAAHEAMIAAGARFDAANVSPA